MPSEAVADGIGRSHPWLEAPLLSSFIRTSLYAWILLLYREAETLPVTVKDPGGSAETRQRKTVRICADLTL